MAKEKTAAKAGVYGLKFGHPTQFSRTVTIGDEKKPQRVQLVFQPNTPYTLTDQELEGVKDMLDAGMLVPWEEDARGNQSPPGHPSVVQKPKSARVETGEVAPEIEPADTAKKDKGDVEHKPRTQKHRTRRK